MRKCENVGTKTSKKSEGVDRHQRGPAGSKRVSRVKGVQKVSTEVLKTLKDVELCKKGSDIAQPFSVLNMGRIKISFSRRSL